MTKARVVLLIAGAVASIGGAVFALASASSCNYPEDFVPYVCAEAAYAGDAASLAAVSSIGSADAGDASALVPNGDFIVTLSEARALAPNGCGGDAAVFGSAATVTLAQCDNSVDAFYRATPGAGDGGDAGPFVIDYYNALTGTFLARVSYTDSYSDGVCALGPTNGFTPPACTGASYLWCGSDAGADAGNIGDAGCGTF